MDISSSVQLKMVRVLCRLIKTRCFPEEVQTEKRKTLLLCKNRQTKLKIGADPRAFCAHFPFAGRTFTGRRRITREYNVSEFPISSIFTHFHNFPWLLCWCLSRVLQKKFPKTKTKKKRFCAVLICSSRDFK